MSDLVERLRSWAQNEEMVDASYTQHGKDCNEAADEIDRLKGELAQWVRGAQELDRKQQRLQAVVDAARQFVEWYEMDIDDPRWMSLSDSDYELKEALRALDGES